MEPYQESISNTYFSNSSKTKATQQKSMAFSSSSSHQREGTQSSGTSSVHTVRTRTKLRGSAVLFELPAVAQSQGNNLRAEKHSLSHQPVTDHSSEIESKPDRLATLEQRIQAMAPFATPPDSPSFRFVPPNFQQPERCGTSTDSDDSRALSLSSTAPAHDPSLDVRLQVLLAQDQLENRISDLLVKMPTPKTFMPSDMVMEKGMLANPGAGPLIQSNGQYRGNRHSNANTRKIANLENTYNCGLFLWNIPESALLPELFDVIDTGAVYALHIMPPNEQHSTCAAKLTFMTPEAAAKFLAKVRSGLWFGEHKLRAKYNNREGSLRNAMVMSRVLLVEGPEPIMTMAYWYEYFNQACIFQWERVLEHACPLPGRKKLEFRFARINGQAQTCLQEIQAQEEFAGIVDVAYGFDPCDQLALRDAV